MSKSVLWIKALRHVVFFSIALFILLAGMARPLFAKTVILEGTPMNMKQSTSQKLKEGALTPEEQRKAKIVISKEGGKYFWDSNGKGEMVLKAKKNSYYFVDLTGKGFVEVVLDEKSGKYLYMENKSAEGTTYYGNADRFVKG